LHIITWENSQGELSPTKLHVFKTLRTDRIAKMSLICCLFKKKYQNIDCYFS
jgi:hypothetical protein